MRTTVDLPPAAHCRAQQLATERGQSLSSTIADLTIRGLAQLEGPVELHIDERSGFPVISVGRRITTDDVLAALDD